MSTITVSLNDTTEADTVIAEYYVMEDGWVTFKTVDHKAVASYPEKRVARIRSEREPAAAQVINIMSDMSAEGVTAVINAANRRAAALSI